MTRPEFVQRLADAITPEPSYRSTGCILPERDERLSELERIDRQLGYLGEILTGLSGRARRTIVMRIDVWLDRRLDITRPREG